MKKHTYQVDIRWTGNQGVGTKSYRSYLRDYDISGMGKSQAIKGSSDPEFRGDTSRYNPEELLVSSISSCHMLWYLHLCSAHDIVVVDYEDSATGVMMETEEGSGRFEKVTLFPVVSITDASQVELAKQLHDEAHKMCFIANSCNFPIDHQAKIIVQE